MPPEDTRQPADPRILSLDIETYGKHTDYPAQTCFSPARSLHVDKVPLKDLILTCSLTIPTRDPRTDSLWDASTLAQLTPGDTLVLRLSYKTHLHLLVRWLNHADTILGMNLPFDIGYLRAFHPLLRGALDGRHTLIDLSAVNYLQCESRPERSLKTLGPVLGTHTYAAEDLATLSDWSQLYNYNAQDTHNTLLAIAHLAKHISRNPADPYHFKLSPFSIAHYSDTIWSCVWMTENGLPMNRPALEAYATTLSRRSSAIDRLCRSMLNYDVILTGAGSEKSKTNFLSRLITTIEQHTTPSVQSVRDDPLLERTEAKKAISFSKKNRDLLCSYLPPSHPLRRVVRLVNDHARAMKLLSTYCTPLLYHRAKKRKGGTLYDRSSTLIPQPPTRHTNPNIWLSHPTWFIVPTTSKDDSGSGGGTLQGRITCKDFSHQTDPDEIIQFRQSRWPGGILVDFDLSQIELRVAALLSGDHSLMRAYLNNQDLHTRRAVSIWTRDLLLSKYPALQTIPLDQWDSHSPFKKFERDVGKHTNFADLFRSGAETMQATILKMSGRILPLDFLQRVVQQRPQDRPGLWAWQESLIHEATTTGLILLPFTGQSRNFLGGDKYEVNEIVNFPVQTTAGNLTLYLQHFLYRRHHTNPSILLFLNTYDSLSFDCRNSHSVSLLRESFEEAIHHQVTAHYWHLLSTRLNRTLPLAHSVKLTPSP